LKLHKKVKASKQLAIYHNCAIIISNRMISNIFQMVSHPQLTPVYTFITYLITYLAI